MIKIISGWSNPGGSTIAHIRLCNLFNENALPCIFYGPHEWHLDKCKGKMAGEYQPDPEDILISHFCVPSKDTPCKKHILSLHETNYFPLKKQDLDIWDIIHYVSNFQRGWQSVNKPYKIIPNVVLPIELKDKKETGVAGIIGSVDSHKRTHLSVQRAFKDGWKKIKIFGNKTDPKYWQDYLPLFQDSRIEYMGHQDNQAEMYSQVDTVYCSSARETFNFVKAECDMLKIPYHGMDSAENDAQYKEPQEILEAWKEIMYG